MLHIARHWTARIDGTFLVVYSRIVPALRKHRAQVHFGGRYTSEIAIQYGVFGGRQK